MAGSYKPQLLSAHSADVHGAVFVVDAADAGRLDEARKLLHEAQEHERLRGKPLLVVANKQDLPQSAAPVEIAEALELHLLSDAAYHIVGGCAKCGGTVGEPLLGGLGWLEKRVRADWGALQPRRERQKAEQKAEEARKRDERKARLAAKRAAREAEEAEATAETAAPVGHEEMGGIELPPADPVNDDPGSARAPSVTHDPGNGVSVTSSSST